MPAEIIENATIDGVLHLAPGSSLTTGAGAVIDMTGATLTLPAGTLPVVFVGDAGQGGQKGLVPAPAAGDAAAKKFLSAHGDWEATPGAPNPLTTPGDLLVGGAAGAQTRLGVGANGRFLGVSGGVPAWLAAPSGGGSYVSPQDPSWPQRAGSLSGTPIASGVHDGFSLAAAFDGVTGSNSGDPAFATSASPGWVGLDFGANNLVTLTQVSVYGGYTGALDQTGPFVIEISSDNVTWTAIGNTTGQAGENAWQNNSVTGATPARYARISLASDYINIAELEFYGVRSGTSSGGSGGGSTVTAPTIVQQVFGRGSGSTTVAFPNPVTAGNLIVVLCMGGGNAAGSFPALAGYVTTFAGSPSNAQSGFAAYRLADGTEGAQSFTFSPSDWTNWAIFELANPYAQNTTAGGVPESGNTLTIAAGAVFGASIRLIVIEWDNSINATAVAGVGATMLHVSPNDGGNHRGAFILMVGSPLVPVVVTTDSGADRPGFIIVEVAGQ